MAKRYQILKKPIATATGQKSQWSFVAHGAPYDAEHARQTCESLESHGYKTKKLPL